MEHFFYFVSFVILDERTQGRNGEAVPVARRVFPMLDMGTHRKGAITPPGDIHISAVVEAP